MSIDRYRAYLNANSIEFLEFHHAAIHTVEDVKTIAPHFLETMVKCIVFRVKEGDLILIAARGKARIDYKLVAEHMGINRRFLRSLSPDEVSAEIGVQPGGVAPIPLAPNHRLLIDADVMNLERIIIGSGLQTVTFELRAQELQAATRADVVKVTR